MKSLARLAVILVIVSPASPTLAAERTATLEVDRMTCASFAVLVKRSLTNVDGVIKATVFLDTRTVTVVFDDAKAGPGKLTTAASEAGFPARARP
ncbi:cation transporter [Methylobacterium sp. 092160098-2]|uniref:cation transporter n=1 Tax=Methylobacterium sp. 092160098-2 TaxID=3025129 RepID=UPI0023819B8F|nr:cation transporter [Methylobacterium sp. 092160098-2]MDE4915991.1 cation transporter [Methylobacterium sp. 092160098-2]